MGNRLGGIARRARDRRAVGLQTQARYLSESMYLLWRQGVQTAIWFLIRDVAPPVTFTAWSSGLYTKQGEPKPALAAFRFPFVADQPRRGKTTVWGIAPAKGKVTIQVQSGAGWRKIGRAKAKGDRNFFKRMKVPKGATVRARKGSDVSLAWDIK